MGAKFSVEEKATLRIQMIQQGFRALKEGGEGKYELAAVL